MDQDLEKKIQERLAEIPADVRAAIQSADLDKKLQDIGIKNQLHLDQIGNLEDEVFLVMLAFTSPDEFVANLQNRLKLPGDKAAAVATDVTNEIFMPIRASMQEFAEARSASTVSSIIGDTVKKPVTPAPASQINAPRPAPMPAPPLKSVTPAAQVPATPRPATPPPPKLPDLHPVEMMLAGKTVSPPPAPAAQTPAPNAPQTPPAQPPKPAAYKADPYREPPE